MSMSKKDFIALADVVRDIRVYDDGKVSPTYPDACQTPLVLWQSMVDALAEFCHGQNPLFKRQRRLDYIAGVCGPSGGSLKERK